MSTETAEGTTTEVIVDAEAQAAAATALATANGAEGKSGDDAAGKDETSTGGEAEASDEVVVTIGDEAPPQEEAELEQAPAWVKELRKTNREQARRIKELERTQPTAQTTETVLGPKPQMKDPEIDYDPAKFEEALTKWNDQKRKVDDEAAEKRRADDQAKTAWQKQLDGYNEAKAKLKVKDFNEAEATALDSLAQVQQGIIVQGAKNPALVVYALGKNPAKLKELSAITDPVKFAFAVATLEGELKVTTRKAPPPPERVVTGTGSKSGVVDSQLEKLRAEAEKTGDFSKVVAYKRSKRVAS